MRQDAIQEFSSRSALAEKLGAFKRDIAGKVNQEFFRRHPEWETRYGAAGVERGFEDVCYHVNYLAAAVEAGSVRLFENYARWTGRVLASRGIAPHFVVENFEQIESALQSRLLPDEFTSVRVYFHAAATALLEASEVATDTETGGARQLFRTALLLGERKAAMNIALDAASNGVSLSHIYLELCSKALWDIGQMWERNQISVADEHRATAIVQYVIAQIYSRIQLHPRPLGNVVVTGVDGEMHQLGANIVADLLEAEGWNVCFLGTNLPHRTILEKIKTHQASAAFISATMPFNLLSVRHLIAHIRSRFGSKIFIVLGGQAFANAPQFFEDAGADAFAPTVDDGAAILARRFEVTQSPSEPGSPAQPV